MTWDFDIVIVAMMALMVLLLVAGAEARWRRRGRRAMAHEPRPTAGSDRVTAGIHPARRRPVGRQVSGAPGLAHAQRLPRRPAAGVESGISTIVAVYRTEPGMVVQELTPELARSVGVSPQTQGVVVTRVQEDSPAEDAGVQQEDVIIEVNQQKIHSLREYRAALGRVKGSNRVVFLIRRGDDFVYIAMKPG
jgi:membrane-associated protease RseP (regulator of RpoE activity)